jgi:transposase
MPAQGYPPELRERAVRLVAECREDHPSEWAAMKSVAAKLGVKTPETVRQWVRQAEAEIGTAARVGVAASEAEELRRLRSEVRELRRANEVLKAAAGFFAAELDRPRRTS